MIAHITVDELIRTITETDANNGLGNRYLWVFAKRSKILPFGGSVTGLESIERRLADIIRYGREDRCMAFDQDARALWINVYEELSQDREGLLGAMLARGEAQVRRVAMLYAILDMARDIGVQHLNAALALWEYCENSAKYIFGDSLNNTTASRILGALQCAEEPVSQTALHNMFSRNMDGTRLLNALHTLQRQGLISFVTERGETKKGRPKTLWYCFKPKDGGSI